VPKKSLANAAVSLALIICAAHDTTIAHAEAPYFKYEVIEPPAQTNAVTLSSVDPDEPDREQWMLQNGNIGVRNVSRPTLTPVLPIGLSTGAAVIVAPGGGFLGLAIDDEGWKVAQWLADHGIAAFVLKYRVLPTPVSNTVWEDEFNRMIRGEKVSFANPADTPPESLADGLAALRHVRENAGVYGIDPQRVGFMGFSAGGFLSRSVVSDGGEDAPDFVAPIYPRMTKMRVPDNAPPMFVAIAANDFLLQGLEGFPLIESYRAAGKPIEFHLFADGGHGFGLGRPGTAAEGWIELFHRWLVTSRLIEAMPDNRAIVSEFARLFYTERDVRQAFETYVAPGYVQHNPGIADGRDAAVAALAPMFAEAGREFRIKRILVDSDMAVIHVHAIPNPGARGASVFDMYRLQDGKIVEHWDVIQPLPEISANDHPMF
jgi:predicted SnoaL-like aldol condensation-catalyzing enzyme/acetyl esterase/lipase